MTTTLEPLVCRSSTSCCADGETEAQRKKTWPKIRYELRQSRGKHSGFPSCWNPGGEAGLEVFLPV